MNSQQHHVVRVLKLPDQAAQQRASEVLRTVAGVGEIETMEEQQLRITYDFTRLSWAKLCDTLIEAGLYSQRGLLARWRDGWRDLLDNNMRENLNHRAACCSKPPLGAGRK